MKVLDVFCVLLIYKQLIHCILLRTGIGIKNTGFTDLKITKQNLNFGHGATVMSCSILCVDNVHCLSYSYNNETHICHLWGEDFIRIDNKESLTEAGWSYYYLIRECSITKHKCLLHHGFDYVKGACFCYRYIPKKLDYQGAVDSCASHNSYLAKVNRGLIQHTLEHILAQKHDGGVRIQGIRDSGKTWRYNNGKTLEYFNWNEHGHQPDLKPNEVTLLIKKSQAYRWHDDFMYRNLSSVCQIY